MDYLHPKLDDAAIARMSSLALAHVGDAVYEILVRSYLACGGTQTAKNLHSHTIALVRASAQAEAVQRILPLRPLRDCGFTEADFKAFPLSVEANQQRLMTNAYYPFDLESEEAIYRKCY